MQNLKKRKEMSSKDLENLIKNQKINNLELENYFDSYFEKNAMFIFNKNLCTLLKKENKEYIFKYLFDKGYLYKLFSGYSDFKSSSPYFYISAFVFMNYTEKLKIRMFNSMGNEKNINKDELNEIKKIIDTKIFNLTKECHPMLIKLSLYNCMTEKNVNENNKDYKILKSIIIENEDYFKFSIYLLNEIYRIKYLGTKEEDKNKFNRELLNYIIKNECINLIDVKYLILFFLDVKGIKEFIINTIKDKKYNQKEIIEPIAFILMNNRLNKKITSFISIFFEIANLKVIENLLNECCRCLKLNYINSIEITKQKEKIKRFLEVINLFVNSNYDKKIYASKYFILNKDFNNYFNNYIQHDYKNSIFELFIQDNNFIYALENKHHFSKHYQLEIEKINLKNEMKNF